MSIFHFRYSKSEVILNSSIYLSRIDCNVFCVYFSSKASSMSRAYSFSILSCLLKDQLCIYISVNYVMKHVPCCDLGLTGELRSLRFKLLPLGRPSRHVFRSATRTVLGPMMVWSSPDRKTLHSKVSCSRSRIRENSNMTWVPLLRSLPQNINPSILDSAPDAHQAPS